MMEWKTVAIKTVCEGIYEGPHATPPASDSGALYLGIPSITEDGRIDFAKVPYISEDDFAKWTKRVTPKFGDVVFTNEATLNLYARIPQGFHGCLGRRLGLVRPKADKIDSNFLFYYFFSPYWKNVIARKKVSGSTVERILMKKFPNFPVLLPPLSVQRQIASILSAYDNLIENNNRRIRLLEQMAENLYKEWFVRFRFPGHEKAEFENGLPKGWKIEKYVNVAKINAGGDKPDYYSQIPTEECSVPVYSNGIVDDGLYGYTNKPKIKKPCITISARGTVGFVCLRRIPFVPIVRLLSVVPNDIINVYYLYHSSIYNDLEGNGTSQQQLTVPMLNKRKILVPSKDTLELFSKNVEPLYDQIDFLKKQSAILSRQRDLLLPRLMSGKLEVKV